nr:hypothetical protein [Tanacetum cinerariifolium]
MSRNQVTIRTIMCQPMDQNIDSSGSDQIQTPQYPDDEEYSIQYREYLEKSSNAIAPILTIEEPEYSLSMGYEHLNITPKTESDEIIKSGVKNLVPILSEYEVTFDDESECDMPIKDDSYPTFTTFSNPLFNDNDDFTSSDDESLPDEDVPIKEFKVYSNPLFDDEEINSDKLDPHCSMLNLILLNLCLIEIL